MITRGDEFPIHQTTEPVARAGGGNRNFYDRYFFNGLSLDGDVYFAVAMGQYPNRGVVDAAFNVVCDGRQHVLRASDRAPGDRMITRVGPIAVEVVEPLHHLRVRVGPNPGEMEAELEFFARAGVIEEPHFRLDHGGRPWMDYTRLTQHTEVGGWIRVGGRELRIDRRRYRGARDRSWGLRPVGEREADAPPGPMQFYWLWSPVHFEDICTHFDVNEHADGRRWHEFGAVVPVGGEPEVSPRLDYRLSFRSGTRRVCRAEVVLIRADGEEIAIELTPLWDFSMSGLGYMHPTWGHGMAVGEGAVTAESWSLAEVNPNDLLHLHIQSICEARAGRRRGVGVLEQLIIGPHEPSGFRELFDTAP